MIPIGVVFYQFYKRMRLVFGNPELRGLFIFVGVIVLLGMWTFHIIEGWGVLDSLYFTVITLTTIGYGDFTPVTPLGKFFTIIYVFVGLGMLAMFFSTVTDQAMRIRREQNETKRETMGREQGN